MTDKGTHACDECGREEINVHRVYKGHRYCVTCYARVFKPSLCPKCGNLARLPRTIPGAICRRCETSRPCIRCGKRDYKTGRVTNYGPVCSACAIYFSEPVPCDICGKFSQRLRRIHRLGDIQRLCPKCARADLGACSACRRHRQLHQDSDGRNLCKRCLEMGEVLCTSCGMPMPAGRGKVCEPCYWAGTCRKRIRIDQCIFTSIEMSKEFGHFGEWLIGRVGSQKAALTIHRYLSFFDEIQRQWPGIPGYADLLEHFGAERLRRVRLPMRWLLETKDIVPDPEIRERDSEHRRIKSILSSIPHNSPGGRALNAYGKVLLARISSGEISPRSVRLALKPASMLLGNSNPTGKILPSQSDMDKYLLGSPGQKASLTGFVRFLNVEYGLDLIVRVDEKAALEFRRKKLEKEIIRMASHPEEGDVHVSRWIKLGLEYFHGVKFSNRSLLAATIVNDGKGYAVSLSRTVYWIPLPASQSVVGLY